MVFKENTGQKIDMICLIFRPISKINSAEIEGLWKCFFIILQKQLRKNFVKTSVSNSNVSISSLSIKLYNCER